MLVDEACALLDDCISRSDALFDDFLPLIYGVGLCDVAVDHKGFGKGLEDLLRGRDVALDGLQDGINFFYPLHGVLDEVVDSLALPCQALETFGQKLVNVIFLGL